MPFKSHAQRRYLWATDPELAKKFEAETPSGADLPDHVGPKKPKAKHGVKKPRKVKRCR